MATPPASIGATTTSASPGSRWRRPRSPAGVGDLAWTPDLLHLNDWTSALTPGLSRLARADVAERPDDPQPRLSGPVRAAAAVARSACRRAPSRSTASSSTASCPSSRPASSTPRTSPRSARPMRARSRRPSSAAASTASCGVRADEGRLTGILNGIDESWDPRTDPHLASTVRRRRTSRARRPTPTRCARIRPRRVARAALRGGVAARAPEGRRPRDRGRRDHRPRRRPDRGHRARRGRASSSRWQISPRAIPTRSAVRLGFDEGTRAADVCRQRLPAHAVALRALRPVADVRPAFGTLPIAHRTGGLADTIEDGVTGFLFASPRSASFSAPSTGRSTPSARARSSTPCAARRWAAHYPWQRSALGYKRVYDRALTGALARS